MAEFISVKIGSAGRTGQRRAQIQHAIEAATATCEESWKNSLNDGKKTGKVYRRGKKGFHQASAPGEAPATDSGGYVGSIHSEVEELEGTIAGAKEYILPLEEGTIDGRIAARPAAKPAFEEGKKVLYEELKAVDLA
jgi:hypothetical protein